MLPMPPGRPGLPAVPRPASKAPVSTRRQRPAHHGSPLDKAHKRAAVLATGRRGMRDPDGDGDGC